MNAEKWIEARLEEAGRGRLLIGAMQMYEATGEERYLQFLRRTLRRCMAESGEGCCKTAADGMTGISDYGRVLYFMYQKTGDESFRTAVEQVMDKLKTLPESTEALPGSTEALPFYMLYETKCGKKEKYNEIVKQFAAERENLKREEASSYLMSLADSMDNMSIEIYEKYRELQELGKALVREQLAAGVRDIRLAYCILKLCRMGSLLKEKYAPAGMELTESLLSGQEETASTDAGEFMMAYAQYLMLKKETE